MTRLPWVLFTIRPRGQGRPLGLGFPRHITKRSPVAGKFAAGLPQPPMAVALPSRRWASRSPPVAVFARPGPPIGSALRRGPRVRRRDSERPPRRARRIRRCYRVSRFSCSAHDQRGCGAWRWRPPRRSDHGRGSRTVALPDQPQIGLMDQDRGIESVARPVVGHLQ
jgi:hypothetical protein